MKVLGANGLQYLITKLMGVDFIVEEGTSGIWTYRKWNSGVYECWGVWEGTLTSYGSSSSYYGYYTDISYPITFVSTPTVTTTSGVYNGFGWTGGFIASANSTSSFRAYALGSLSGTQSIIINASVRGKWK